MNAQTESVSSQKKWSKAQAWCLAIRPKTLPASVAGVITGAGIAIAYGHFQLLPSLAALGVGLLLQIASNLANDVFDYEKGTDTAERLGPIRVTQAGILTPAEVKKGLGISIFLALLLGIYLIRIAGWPAVIIGLSAILAAIFYTGGPFPLGYYGLGDLFVFLFFGLAAVVGTYYVQAKSVAEAAWWMAVPIGLLVVNLLVVNNLRDIPTDRRAGKFTMALLLGEKGSRIEYVLFQMIAYLMLPVLVHERLLPYESLLAWITIPLAVKVSRTVLKETGRKLNQALGATSSLAMWYGITFCGGILLSLWI